MPAWNHTRLGMKMGMDANVGMEKGMANGMSDDSQYAMMLRFLMKAHSRYHIVLQV